MLLAVLAPVALVRAQSGPVCTVATDSITPSCPTASGWLGGVTCQHRTVSCPSVGGVTINDLGITFGHKKPAGTVKGTIVFLSNSGGTSPEGFPGQEMTFAADYYNSGFEVIQTAWDSDWEDTGTSTENIAYAAGRPAAFLSWAKTNYYDPVHTANSTAGMCVHGTSAGSAAAFYALSWYGAYIDKVEALSGPTLADIRSGCAVFTGSSTLVQVCPSGQLGCNPYNSPGSWSQNPLYSDARSSVRTWTARSSCAGTSTTSSADNSYWKAMSIVDGTVGTFTYSNTNVAAWLCSSVQSLDGLNDGVMNDSSPEAQLFFQNFTTSTQIPKGLSINAVVGCVGTEGVYGGTPPSNFSGNGKAAIEADMENATTGCVSNH